MKIRIHAESQRIFAWRVFKLLRMNSESSKQSVSHLLAPLVLKLLSKTCQSLAMAVIQLYLTDHIEHITRRKYECGVLCLVRDSERHCYFFQLYCVFKQKLVWEHEVHGNLDYLSPKALLMMFERENTTVVLKFASEHEMRHMRTALLEKMEFSKKQQDISNGHSSDHQNSGTKREDKNGVVRIGKQRQPTGPPRRQNQKDFGRKITKAEISLPSDFKHVAHMDVDFDRVFGFNETEDPQLKEFIIHSGTPFRALQNRAKSVDDMINHKNDPHLVKNKLVSPPPPPRESVAVLPPVPAPRNLGVNEVHEAPAPSPRLNSYSSE